MKLYVHKYPDAQTLAACREVADDAATPNLPLELMTVAEFEAWKAAPAQVTWLADFAAAKAAAQAAADAADESARNLLEAALAEAQLMIDGTGTTAERQRRVELGFGRYIKWLARKGRLL